ncbi:unnamed protein product [Durusdinium trenchii]|uniref:Uncharacterized protein n=1 Tax=Durusdinium trenchii TaxID=1381693 RepID=A0ABP0IQU1_9DINO
MINLAAEAVRMQTVIGYYAYDTYKQQRYPEMRTICNFFEQWGVSDRIGLDAYVAVLRLIDHNVRAMDPDYLWEDDHVYHKVVCRIMVALKTGDQRVDKYNEYEEQEMGEDQDEAKQSPWARFITEAKQLRIVWTESKKFRAPVEVAYIADGSDWLPEAQDFVTNAHKDTADGFKQLGLQDWSEATQHQLGILPECSAADELESTLARAIFLVAVRSGFLQHGKEWKDLSKIAWHLAAATKFLVVRGQDDAQSRLQVQPVVMRTFEPANARVDGTAVVTSPDQHVVAYIKKLATQERCLPGYLQGYQEKRQPALALCAYKSPTALRLEEKSKLITKWFFRALAHFTEVPESSQLAKTLKQVQEEVQRSLHAVADSFRNQRKQLAVNASDHISKLVQDAAKRANKKSSVKKNEWTWDLERVLQIDSTDAWRRLLAGRELHDEGEGADPAAGPAAAEGLAEAEAEAAEVGEMESAPAARHRAQPVESDSEEDLEPGASASLEKFCQRQIERQEEMARPLVRPVSEEAAEQLAAGTKARAATAFTSFVPHGLPHGTDEGGTGTWAGQAGQEGTQEGTSGGKGPVDPCISGWHHTSQSNGNEGEEGAEDPSQQAGAAVDSWGARHGGGQKDGNGAAATSAAGSAPGGHGSGPNAADAAADAAAGPTHRAPAGGGSRWTRSGQGTKATSGDAQDRSGRGVGVGLGSGSVPKTGAPLTRSLSAPELSRSVPLCERLPLADLRDGGIAAQVRASIIQTMLEGDLPSHWSLDPAVMEILWRIFHEGKAVLNATEVHRQMDPVEEWVRVDKVFFSHENISQVFSNGVSVLSLVEDLWQGKSNFSDPRLRLEVVCYQHRIHSLCNRRLYAFKEYQKRLQKYDRKAPPVQIHVRRWPLDPITAKFVLAYTTTCQGQRIALRPFPRFTVRRPEAQKAASAQESRPVEDDWRGADPWAMGSDPWSLARSSQA